MRLNLILSVCLAAALGAGISSASAPIASASQPAPQNEPRIVDAVPIRRPGVQRLPPVAPSPNENRSAQRRLDLGPSFSQRPAWDYQPLPALSVAPVPSPYSLPYESLYARFLQEEGGAADAAAGEAANLESRREPIGEAPPESVNEQFIRSSILLAPGELQMEVGITYAWQETLGIVILPPGNLFLERIRSRRLLVPFSLRYGYSEKLEIFGILPLGVAQFERDTPRTEATERSGALGDITVGGVYQLLKSEKNRPDVTATFSLTAPTASNPFPTPNGNVASLGNGFWALGGGVTLIKSFDPVVFYGGCGVLYQVEREYFGVNVAPGVQFNYNLGVGFAVNEDITFTTQFLWATQLATLLDRVAVRNSDNEPMVLRLSVIKRTSLKTRVQPFVAFALNDDATDVQFGIFFTRDIKSCHDCLGK